MLDAAVAAQVEITLVGIIKAAGQHGCNDLQITIPWGAVLTLRGYATGVQ
jgi:hypothetical protein